MEQRKNNRIKISDRVVEKNQPVFVIAEISANHGQDFHRALELIKKANECGADAVKFQAYTPDTMTIDMHNKYFKVKHPKWGGQTLYQLYKKAYTPWEWFKDLKKFADDLGIVFFATAFDKTSVDLLEDLDVSIHKISSFELVDLPLIEYAAKTEKPIIISTGMGTKEEIAEAVSTAKKAGTENVILLKCVSNYPAEPKEMNLQTIPDMRKRFKCPVGLSDHTLGIGVSIAGVSLGATVIEKHFTLSRDIKTLDSFFSIEPQELKVLIDNVKTVESALGEVKYGLTDDQNERRLSRRSLFAVKNIRKGEKLTTENIKSIRPGHGLLPKFLKDVIKYKATNNIKRGTPLTWDLVTGNK